MLDLQRKQSTPTHYLEIIPRSFDYQRDSKQITYMDTLQTFLSDIAHPVLILDQASRTIHHHNRSAAAFGKNELKGRLFEECFHVFGEEISEEPLIHMPQGWFSVHESDFIWDEKIYTKVECKPRAQSPNHEVLKGWKNMISVMLHRFRSPLTGVKGFLNMMEDENTDPALDRRLLSINSGIDRLFGIMDEMESIYQIDNQPTSSFEQTNIDEMLNEVLASLDPDQQARVHVHGFGKGQSFNGPRANILPIVKILVDNALEHDFDGLAPVYIHLYSNRFIQVINKGADIPERVHGDLFSPFVTSKADHIGIGLTLATLHAQQFGGAIVHKSDQSSGNIYFTLCFP